MDQVSTLVSILGLICVLSWKYKEPKNTYVETELANLQSHCMSIMTRAVVSAFIEELMGQAYGSASILLGDAITILSRLSLSFVFHLQAEHE